MSGFGMILLCSHDSRRGSAAPRKWLPRVGLGLAWYRDSEFWFCVLLCFGQGSVLACAHVGKPFGARSACIFQFREPHGSGLVQDLAEISYFEKGACLETLWRAIGVDFPIP